MRTIKTNLPEGVKKKYSRVKGVKVKLVAKKAKKASK